MFENMDGIVDEFMKACEECFPGFKEKALAKMKENAKNAEIQYHKLDENLTNEIHDEYVNLAKANDELNAAKAKVDEITETIHALHNSRNKLRAKMNGNSATMSGFTIIYQ